MKLHHPLKINRADDIDIVQNEGLVDATWLVEKKMSRLLQPAASIEQSLLTRNFDTHAKVVVGFQIIDDHVGKVMHIDDHFANATLAQARNRDLQQRLRAIVRNRP